MVKYLLKLHTTDDVITETGAKVMGFSQPPNKILLGFTKVIWFKSLCYDLAYNENVLKRQLHWRAPRLHPLEHSIVLGFSKPETGQDLERRWTSVMNLQNGSRCREGTPDSNVKGSHHDNCWSQTPAVKLLTTDGKSTDPIYGLSGTPNTATVMVMQQPEKRKPQAR